MRRAEWRHILRRANLEDVAQEAIETGLSSKIPPAVRNHRLPPKLLRVSLNSDPEWARRRARPPRSSKPPRAQGFSKRFSDYRAFMQGLHGFTFQEPPGPPKAPGPPGCPGQCGRGQCSGVCLYIFGGLGCASRCMGGAWRGSIRPLSIGSSHCLTQYGCKG